MIEGLVLFAISEFKLSSIEDGKTTREHYISAWKSTGNRPKQLDQPILDDLISHVWVWFLDLHRVRGNTGFGPATITYSDISCWSKLLGIELRVWEIKALCLLDKAYISESMKTSKQ